MPATKPKHTLLPGYTNAPPLLSFLYENWADIATQLLCLTTAILLYTLCPPLMSHWLPSTPDPTFGLKYGQPVRKEYINTIVMAVISFGVPAVVMGSVGLWCMRDFWDGNAAIKGLGLALSTSTLTINILKITIGGLRPHFLSICDPQPPHPWRPPMWSTVADLCASNDTGALKEAQMSWPSGHACSAFAGFGFLALWLNAKVKAVGFGRRRRARSCSGGEEWEWDDEEKLAGLGTVVVVVFLPVVVAGVLAGSKVRDGWHHPVDVVCGGLIGVVFAHVGFLAYYLSVYDTRYNHIPR
ncbi:PAP2-domain-containing protein [Decorospora gaudefroyi]|uniref:PAP2-domain-containing protein n=1 Tax=Decorospora gaudefroyi TaxID=184978 RepID=A0A6A5KP24_9PLEO|nr:PAP2-domain-containing protein [Decorospora gaudefroyi]